jgi:hypothetical protein
MRVKTMSIFTDIADQWQIADDAFSALESMAFAADDDQAFDVADKQRRRNDQAYFLFLFTRFEELITQAVKIITSNRAAGDWSERRIWEAWSALVVKDGRSMHFLSKAEVITDKSRHDYEVIKNYYDGRNAIAHGGIHAEQFVIPEIAANMDNISSSFPTK